MALENLQADAELEERVRDRTAELKALNADVRRLAITDEVAPLATRLDAALATVNARAGVAVPLSTSTGWAVAGADKLDDLDHLLGIADARTYEAKRSRRPA